MVMMKWSSRVALPSSRKFGVSITVAALQGLQLSDDTESKDEYSVEVKWKGPKTALGSRFRKSNKKDRTCLASASAGECLWKEEFSHECVLLPAGKPTGGSQELSYQPWDVSFVVCKVVGGAVEKPAVMGTVYADLSRFVAQQEVVSHTEDLEVAFSNCGGLTKGTLKVVFTLAEIPDERQVAMVRSWSGTAMLESKLPPHPRSKGSSLEGQLSDDDDCDDAEEVERELSQKSAKGGGGSRLAGLFGRGKKEGGPEGKPFIQMFDRSPARSSLDDEDTEEEDGLRRETVCYGSVQGVNLAVAVESPEPLPELLPVLGPAKRHDAPPLLRRGLNSKGVFAALTLNPGQNSNEEEDSASDSDDQGPLSAREAPGGEESVTWLERFTEFPFGGGRAGGAEKLAAQDADKGGGGPFWRKRNRANIWSPRTFYVKDRAMGLLTHQGLPRGEEGQGGDDIDWERVAQVQAEVEHPLYKLARRDGDASGGVAEEGPSSEALCGSSVFGEEPFTVGRWQKSSVGSRDGAWTLRTDMFFASVDQRHESAAGEGACTALVALLADWLQRHPGFTPNRVEFDALIREGSAEWRRLCGIDAYKQRFPDKHFDLDTVLEAGHVRVGVVPHRSFVGFFQPEGAPEVAASFASSLGFLEGAMTFDDIWQEVELAGPGVYVVSWNDHFFLLVVEAERCFVIDTLGERLFEGCTQAYMVRFDAATTLHDGPPVAPTQLAKAPAASSIAFSAGHGQRGQLSRAAEEGGLIKPEQREGGAGADKSAALPPSAPPPPPASGRPMSKLSVGDVCDGGKAVTAMTLCGLFIKRFFAAVPLRELARDVETAAEPMLMVHKRLQVELHFMQSLRPPLPTPPGDGGALGA
eukprot:jgi/Mesen1/6799/ME000035S06177